MCMAMAPLRGGGTSALLGGGAASARKTSPPIPVKTGIHGSNIAMCRRVTATPWMPAFAGICGFWDWTKDRKKVLNQLVHAGLFEEAAEPI